MTMASFLLIISPLERTHHDLSKIMISSGGAWNLENDLNQQFS